MENNTYSSTEGKNRYLDQIAPQISGALSGIQKNIQSLLQEQDNQQAEIQKLKKKITRKVSKLQNISKTKTKKSFTTNQELDLNIKQINSLNDCLDALSKSELIHSFSQLNIYVHEKGSPRCSSYNISYKEVNSKIAPLTHFNQLFTKVKKSKKATFKIKANDNYLLENFGHYLPFCFEYKDYRFIFIFSNNSFLTPSKEEENKIKSIATVLAPLLHKLYTIEQKNRKAHFITEVLKEFPLPLKITNNNEIILSNTSPQKEPKNVYTANLIDNSKITISNDYLTEITSDLLHNKRILLLGELINTLQHEISNPLFGLQLSTENILKKKNNEDVTGIINSIKRCQSIIKNFHRLYQNNDFYEEINLNEIINSTLTLTKIETRSINISLDYQCELSDLEIRTNPTWISQIIFNIVVNSAQALKEKNVKEPKINLLITNHENIISVTIQDNGPGIPPEMLESLFEPFFTTKKKGTGLGLSICKNLVQKLGGKIFYDNSFSHGAKFVINLPK